MKTYNEIFLLARKKLREAGIDAHDLEARLIMSCATGKTREELLRDSRLYVTDDTIESEVSVMVERRIRGEPVAYIVGEWEFYGMPILVNNSVLIPRVDTEVLAGELIALIRAAGGRRRVLDLCAGSGCIGLAIAANVPGCRVLLADKSEQALKLCRANILKNRLTHSATAIESDAKELPPPLLGRFDVIVSNPPYIPTSDIKTLDSSVRDYEPALALDGGEDGLDFYRAIASKWPMVLSEGGYLAFECGLGQADAVCEIMKDNGFVDVRNSCDSLGIERVVLGRYLHSS